MIYVGTVCVSQTCVVGRHHQELCRLFAAQLAEPLLLFCQWHSVTGFHRYLQQNIEDMDDTSWKRVNVHCKVVFHCYQNCLETTTQFEGTIATTVFMTVIEWDFR
eukprot:3544753-Amphidinium_carterae.1